jgi:ribosomal 50S subunit-recycling heat shock protein
MRRTLLLKQRALAKTLCDKQYVKINGQYTKPSKHVVVGDIIEIETVNGKRQYRILMIPSGNVRKSDRDKYYEEIV